MFGTVHASHGSRQSVGDSATVVALLPMETASLPLWFCILSACLPAFLQHAASCTPGIPSQPIDERSLAWRYPVRRLLPRIYSPSQRLLRREAATGGRPAPHPAYRTLPMQSNVKDADRSAICFHLCKVLPLFPVYPHCFSSSAAYWPETIPGLRICIRDPYRFNDRSSTGLAAH
ncbi:hypothetical protein GGR52DRAFT_331054 [Hypoxylon sp. FL1284]|nr:hypothetical protein GGR52DRAFT_331054 [Hypoxylon sp. FL1284]